MTALVGIVNVTPDSFSDGGLYIDREKALAHAAHLHDMGAAILDIGAESTRPGATIISSEEEWQRLETVLPALVKNYEISVDTRYEHTASKAIDMGVSWINDVSGLHNPAMIELVQGTNVKCVVMHSLIVPADKAIVMPEGCDVIAEIYRWAEFTLERLMQAGLKQEQIVIDPGIGFGKTAQQSWECIDNIEQLQLLGVPLYVGHSRKSFLGSTLAERDSKTLEVSRKLIDKGIEYIRVHDVAAHAQAFMVKET